MKAYYVYCDPNEYDRLSVVVFAESAGQAKMEAMGSGYLGDDCAYLELRAKRVQKLDKSFRGHSYMEWDLDMQDRIDLYEANVYRCDRDYMMDYDCERCPLKDRCEEYKEVFFAEEDDKYERV